MKKIILVHGWGGSPKDNWFPWIKKELEQRNFQVIMPEMPNTDEPKIEEWVPVLKKLSGNINENTHFVGHSIGCQTIMRYLQDLTENVKIGGIVFIAPWFNLKNLEPEEKPIAKPWLTTRIYCKKVLNHTNKIIAIFSDDDNVVPQSDAKLFKERLNAKIIVEHKKGHFNDKKYPSILKEILEITK